MRKKISLLGATGSIGIQTIDIIEANPELFELVSFSAGMNLMKVRELAIAFKPTTISVMRRADMDVLKVEFPNIKFVHGNEGLIEVAAHTGADILLNAVSGSVGLKPTLEAIEAGITIAIANKETLVAAGDIVIEAARKKGVPLLPVDSEHSALFQALNGENPKRISKLILTASGGSFRDLTRKQLENVTVEQALAHPNWSMGNKLTIDSATMMNKGLEVIEAHHLFNIPYEKIDVLLHRESIIHSMVEFVDTSVMAQLGSPDMRVPIQYALTYPDRISLKRSEPLKLEEVGQLNFEKMDYTRFKALALAYAAGKEGGTMPAAMNAANEVAVGLFLSGKISFLRIDDIVERIIESHKTISSPDLQTITEIDFNVRNLVYEMVE